MCIYIYIYHPFIDGFSIRNHPFWIPPFMETPIDQQYWGENTEGPKRGVGQSEL